jgi:hypothetical protein
MEDGPTGALVQPLVELDFRLVLVAIRFPVVVVLTVLVSLHRNAILILVPCLEVMVNGLHAQ